MGWARGWAQEWTRGWALNPGCGTSAGTRPRWQMDSVWAERAVLAPRDLGWGGWSQERMENSYEHLLCLPEGRLRCRNDAVSVGVGGAGG